MDRYPRKLREINSHTTITQNKQKMTDRLLNRKTCLRILGAFLMCQAMLLSPAQSRISVTQDTASQINPTIMKIIPSGNPDNNVDVLQGWLNLSFIMEDTTGKQETVRAKPIASPVIDANAKLIKFHQDFQLSVSSVGRVLIRYKRDIDLIENSIKIDTEIINQSPEPKTLRSEGVLPILVNRKYNKVDLYYSSGTSNLLDFSRVSTGYFAIFEDPRALRIHSSQENFYWEISDNRPFHHRANFNISPSHILVDYVGTDIFNNGLKITYSNNSARYILRWLLPKESIHFGYTLHFIKGPHDRHMGIVFPGWYPKGYETAFCLQADEIKPDVETPNTARNRYKAVENIMLGKIHRTFPDMKMQAIVVVDDMNPYNKDSQPLEISPSYHGENDLGNNPDDVKRYQGWLETSKSFFKLQSHAVHHTPSNKPGGLDYIQCWEFNITDEHGSGKWAENPTWVKSMINRLKSEMEESGLGTQTYFKAAGYQRSYPLAQALAEAGYKVWDYNPTTGNNMSEPYHLRFRYVAPGGQVLWIVGSGPALELKSTDNLDDYWIAINRQLSRGYPLITSGHLEWLNTYSDVSILMNGWERMYQNYKVWNAWPDEMAAYWEKRRNLSVNIQEESRDKVLVRITNQNKTEITNPSFCYMIPAETPLHLKKITIGKETLPHSCWHIHNNILYFYLPEMSPSHSYEVKLYF
jgi:hypothetical protein